eukprot:Opistho-1_new@87099
MPHSVRGRLPPLHRPEAIGAEQRVVEAHGAQRLRAVADAGIVGVAVRPDVLHAHGVPLVEAPVEGGVDAGDVVAPGRAVGDAAEEVLLRLQVDRGAVAGDQPQREAQARRHAVVVVAVLGGAAQRAGGRVAQAGEHRALQCQPLGGPPLPGRAERQRGGREVEDLRRQVVVAAVQAPQAADVVADRVVGAEQQAAGGQRLHAVGAGGGGVEAEVVERAAVGVAVLARQAVVEREVDHRLVAFQVARAAQVVLRRAGDAEAQPAVVDRVVVDEGAFEARAEGEAREAQRGRDAGGDRLAPGARQAARAVEHQMGHAEQRFAQEAAGDAAGDLVVVRRRRLLAEDLPAHAAGEGVAGRFPVAQAARAGGPVVQRALVGVGELVDVERVVVDHPGPAQVAADRRAADVVIGRAAEAPVVAVQQEVEADDLQRRDDVALVGCAGGAGSRFRRWRFGRAIAQLGTGSVGSVCCAEGRCGEQEAERGDDARPGSRRSRGKDGETGHGRMLSGGRRTVCRTTRPARVGRRSLRRPTIAAMAKPIPRLTAAEIQRVIATAWDDRPPLSAVLGEHGLSHGELVKLLKREVTPNAYKVW